MAIRYHCPQCRQLLSIATSPGRPSDPVSHVLATGTQCRLESEPERPHPAPAATTKARPNSHRVGAESRAENRRAAEPADQASAQPARAWRARSGPRARRRPIWPVPRWRIGRHHWADDDEEDEGFVIQGVERKSDELDLIPMVDCVFLLLVFYMITASYALQKMIDMAAPAADKKGRAVGPKLSTTRRKARWSCRSTRRTAS